MTSCRVKCLQTLSVELLVAASADPRMKRRCSYALGSFVRCPLCSADASLGCFQPLGPSTSDTRTEKRIPCNLRYMATAILWKQLCVVATWKSMGGTLAQNCPREELELELEPLRSAAALRAFEGKAFTVVAFDFGFSAFSGRLPLTFSCTIPGIAKFLFCFNSFVAMMGSASSTLNAVRRCCLHIAQRPGDSIALAGAARWR